MKAKNPIKARVVAPYNYQNDPVSHGVPNLSKGPTIKVTRKNTTTDGSGNKPKTSVDWSKGADQPFTDMQRQARDLKMFKQAELMTMEKAGWKRNPVRQDCNEAWGRFQGQQEQ
jgi:hypothetical protein